MVGQEDWQKAFQVDISRKNSEEKTKKEKFEIFSLNKAFLGGAIIGGLIGAFFPIGIYDISSSTRIMVIIQFALIGAFILSGFYFLINVLLKTTKTIQKKF